MGNTFAIGPEGSIYPCYRFVGMPEWVMGHVRDHPTMDDLMQSDAGQRMTAFSGVCGFSMQRLLAYQILQGRVPL